MKYLKLFEQFNEHDPFGEEFSEDRNEHYFIQGLFYILEENLPSDETIEIILKCVYVFDKSDCHIYNVLTTKMDNPYIMISFEGDLEIQNKKHYELVEIADNLKKNTRNLMKEITNDELEDFQVGLERE